jgi:hypothetical protein
MDLLKVQFSTSNGITRMSVKSSPRWADTLELVPIDFGLQDMHAPEDQAAIVDTMAEFAMDLCEALRYVVSLLERGGYSGGPLGQLALDDMLSEAPEGDQGHRG